MKSFCFPDSTSSTVWICCGPCLQLRVWKHCNALPQLAALQHKADTVISAGSRRVMTPQGARGAAGPVLGRCTGMLRASVRCSGCCSKEDAAHGWLLLSVFTSLDPGSAQGL